MRQGRFDKNFEILAYIAIWVATISNQFLIEKAHFGLSSIPCIAQNKVQFYFHARFQAALLYSE